MSRSPDSPPAPDAPPPLPGRTAAERNVVYVLMAVQFINILDFMMVMPLGPFFSAGLSIPNSQVGIIAGSYTAAAAVSGLAGSFFLDRFDRRKALGVAMLGLVLGTAAGGFATGLHSLMLARVIAGLFGGPATSLSFSIISDVVPAQRRGRAVGEVMSAFAIASIAGVPAGLWLAAFGGWRMPFFCIAGLGVPVVLGALSMLPPMRSHLDGVARAKRSSFLDLFRRPLVLSSYLMTAVAMAGGFVLIPNLPTYLQNNLGYPREQMWKLYLAAGVVSWLLSKFVVGRLVDRYGSFRVGTVGAVILIGVVYASFARPAPLLPILAIYMVFFFGMGFRNVSFNTLTTKVPSQQERARFQSIQSAVNHLATSGGTLLASRLLHDQPDGRVSGMSTVAYTFIGFHLVFPLLVWVVERGVNLQAAPVAPALAEPAA